MTNNTNCVMVLPQQQPMTFQQKNVQHVNFKNNSRNQYAQSRAYGSQYSYQDEFALQKAIQEQQKEQKKQRRRNTIITVISATAALVSIGFFGSLLFEKYGQKIKAQAVKKAQTEIKKDLKTENVTSLGTYIKFENIVDNPLIADFSETKTLAPDVKKMLMNMMNDSKIEEKYIIAAGLEHKPFPNAAILTGPTGTGKTEAIRMYAKKTKANFAVIKLTDFSNSYVDGTAGNMSKMFEDMERLLTENPDKEFVFFFDEADGIAKKLENIDGNHNFLNVNRQTFLLGIEKIKRYKNCKCFAASNVKLDELDKAVINRFGKTIEFKLPTKTQMIEALKFHLKDAKNIKRDDYDFFVKQKREIDKFAQDMVSKKSSFRDLYNVVNEAEAEHCRTMSAANDENMLFDIKYLQDALKTKGKNANELK